MGGPFSTSPCRGDAPRAGVMVEVLRSRKRSMRRRRSRPGLDLHIVLTLRPVRSGQACDNSAPMIYEDPGVQRRVFMSAVKHVLAHLE